MPDLTNILAVARGDRPADLVLSGGRVINVFTGEIEELDIAIANGRIAGLGDYKATQRIDLNGAFVSPGWIDAHMHMESSLCVPAEFAQAIVPRGVTTVVTDPHEIANVAGAAGVAFMIAASRGLALNVVTMGPSCVPATDMASAGGALTADELRRLREDGDIHGLAEAMNFPGVIGGDPKMHAKLAALAGRPVDGHCPGVTGPNLNAYIAAGIGSDHESVTADEAREKLRRGLYLLIREATNARNLDALLPVIAPQNSRRICFCSDDRTPGDLLREGSIDNMIRRAITFGIEPIEAIRMATLNPAEWFGLRDVGAIAPGRRADLVIFDDLQAPKAREVYCNGTKFDPHDKPSPAIDAAGLGTCSVDWQRTTLSIPATGRRIHVIGSRPDQLLTDHHVIDARIEDGLAVADVERDLLKMAVIERHRATGNVGLGFIQGIGLERGAIAGTFAHDHHNLVCIGADDASMLAAAHVVAKLGGGLAVTDGERVVAQLALPVGGLMSDRPIRDVADAYDACVTAARELGSTLEDPFMAMSFMALEVIPSLKLTDRGLVDVERFELVNLFVD